MKTIQKKHIRSSNIIALIFIFTFIFSHANVKAQGNNFIELSGTIVDQDDKQPLSGITVSIKGTVTGISTNSSGKFQLRTRAKYPFSIIISSIGFQTQEFVIDNESSDLQIEMVTQYQLVREVVVTASRVEESILKSPVAIEKLDIRAIRESPAPSFYDALGNVKGVQMTTSSLTFKIPNTRGFNIPSNYRFMQLVDDVDMQAATLGVPLGNAIGPTELDIASVEITPGAASALYGMNAINGMSNLITKSPFLYQGLSIYQKVGINHVGGTGRDLSSLTETAFRYAKAFNNKFAFKVNFSYLKGTDWVSDTRIDQNPNSFASANPRFPALNGTDVAYDGWNKYGDDILAGSNKISLSGLTINGTPNQTLNIARTGYWERDLVSPNVDNLKFDAALHYRINDHAELSYAYRFGKMDGVFQRGNKIQLDNVTVKNHKLVLKGPNYVVRSYVSIEDSGDSFNVKPLADNLDLSTGGSANSWQTRFKTGLDNYVSTNGPLVDNNLADALSIARKYADANRVVPGTPEFIEQKNLIRSINNWDVKSATIPDATPSGGAALVQKSNLYHLEGQWDISKVVKFVDVLIGGDARIYEVIPDGNTFVDFSRPIADRSKPLSDGSFGDNIYYKKFGGFTQLTKTLFEEKLKLFGSLRIDYNPEFSAKLTPRLAAVYSPDNKHNFRVTYQQGYRFPALFEAISYVNNGRVKRVGSLGYINEGLGYLDNSYTRASAEVFNAAVNATNPATLAEREAAAIANKDLLVKGDLVVARPERINSWEIGYKSILAENKLVIDVDAYTNTYDGFLGQVQVDVARGQTVGTNEAAITMLDVNRDNQDRYRVYTNAKNIYRNYGAALGLTYNFYKQYTVAGNISFNKIKSTKEKDVFVTGFNTPEWGTNFSFGNREVIKNIGFSVVYKWQQEFEWESPLVNGTVPSIHTFDAQITYKVPQLKANVKVGGTNIFNKNYFQYAGGPTLGGLYYIAFTFDGLLN